MKKVISCAFLIIFAVCGCSKSNDISAISTIVSIKNESSNRDESETSILSQVMTTSSTAPSEDNRILHINKPMQYFFVEHSFVGGYSDQKWVSVIDPKDPHNENLYNDFLLKDLLNTSYDLYIKEEYIGTAKQTSFFAGDGPGGFGMKTCLLLTPFAKSVDGYGESLIFNMPVKMSGEEIDTLVVPNYSFDINMSVTDINLEAQGERLTPSLSTNAKITLPQSIILDSPLNSVEKNIVQDVLMTNGAVYTDPQIQKTTVDLNSDGKLETLLFVNMRRDANGYHVIGAENKKFFTFILLFDDIGTSKTIFSRFDSYAKDLTAQYRIVPCGVYDLNNDGFFEVCFNMIDWEGGYIAVLSKAADSDWEIVLRSNYGM